ncbi:MAG: FHA domain-containing serine/threonine-protein kinase [Pirellulales bacterium]
MNYTLTIVGGPDKSGRTFALKPGQSLVIGRGRESHTQIQDPRVSRVHCRLEWHAQHVVLVDGGATSETLVNGAPVTRTELIPGAVIQVGETLLRFDAPALDQPTLPPARPRPAASQAAPPPPVASLVGRTLGAFTLVKPLATTRSGVLFEARNTQTSQPAAVKVLSPDLLSQDEQKRRFIRAMKTMLPLQHENMVRILNAGRVGPYCWTAMELIDGENLQDVIRRLGVGKMVDWRESWRAAVHVGRALQFAFSKGFIHRNVNPNNILHRRTDRTYLLGDHLLAKTVEASTHDPVTQPGKLLGDLAYMAPERTYSSPAVDIRSDLYGLGATLYTLLTGRPPFVADTFKELVRLVRDHQPRPPREYALSMNSDFSDLVLSLLAKRPEDRPPVPSVMLTELERIGRLANVKA